MDSSHPDNSRAEAIIIFAREIQTLLSGSNDFNETLHRDALCTLDKFIDEIPLPATAVPHAIRHQMDHEGVQLWNMCVQETLHPGDRKVVVICKLKALAYLMIESVASRHGAGSFRVLEVALKTAKACAETSQFELSQRIIEIIAMRLDDLENSNIQNGHNQLQSATVEYYMLRTYLSWSRGRADIADHLFSKIPATHIDKNQNCVLETCYKIGNLALLSHEYHTAARWLERALNAYEHLSNCSQVPNTSLEKKSLLVMIAFVRACLHVDNMESKESLRKALESLIARHGDNFAVQILQLEVLGAEEPLDNQAYLQAIQSCFKRINHNHVHLNILMRYIQKLRESDVECYLEALKRLLTEIIGSPTERDMIESIFIRLVWALTDASVVAENAVDIFQDTSKRLMENLGPLSEDATHASLILIWKYIDIKISANDASIAEKWCSFVLEQQLFQISLDNRGKLLRKLIYYALDNPGIRTLHGIYEKMPIQCQRSPSTLYLMYKHAFSRGDLSQASTYLKSLCGQGDEADAYLLPCMEEALQARQSIQAAKILERVLAIPDNRLKISIKSLFQPVLHLLLTEIETSGQKEEGLVLQAMSIFEIAVKEACRKDEVQSTSTQLQWLSHKSYNAAVQLHKHSRPKQALQLLGISTKFAGIHQQILPPETQTNVHKHILLCDFLRSVITVSKARKAKSVIQKKKHYQELHGLTKHFHSRFHSLKLELESDNPETQREWLPKYRMLLALGFEAAIFLHKWDDAASVIETAGPVTDAQLPSILVDCLFRSEAPLKEMARMFKLIIRTLHTTPSPFLNPGIFQTALPHYLRILFQLSLDAEDTPLAESVLDQTLLLAEEARQPPSTSSTSPGHRHGYPNEEIQWLSTVAFNRAVEFYRASRDEECRRWAQKAIALADLMDGVQAGGLGGLLRRNLKKLFSSSSLASS